MKQSIEENRKFYNLSWSKTKKVQKIFSYLANNDRRCRHRIILSSLKSIVSQQQENLRILELGCGLGELADKLSSFGYVTAIDLSNWAIERNRAKYPHVEFISGNILTYDFHASHYDVVICSEVIEHIPVEEQKTLITIAANTLKPRGFAIFTTPNKKIMSKLKIKEHQPIENWLSVTEFQNLASDKFEIINSLTTFFTLRWKYINILWRLFWPTNLIGDYLIKNSTLGKYLVFVLRKL